MQLSTDPKLRRHFDWRVNEDGVLVKPIVLHKGEPVYELQRRQWDVYRMTPLVPNPELKPFQPTRIGYGGAAGGGKSFLGRAVAAGVAHKWPGSVTGLFRRTWPEIWSNHITKFQIEVPRSVGVYRGGSVKEFQWHNGSRTVCGYLRTEADLDRYQGQEFDCLIFEESTHYEWHLVNWLISNRLRSSGAEGSHPFALFPSNPGGPGHFWFKRWFIDRRFRDDLEEDPRDFYFLQAKLHHNEILRARDPKYEIRLRQQPEPYRSWYLLGDWSKGAMTALPQLDRNVHLVDAFKPPDHWPIFGAFDWGFAHWWVFGLYCASEDGRIYKIETLRGRRQPDMEIIKSIRETCRARELPLEMCSYIASDRGVFAKRGRDIGYEGPTLGERMIEAGLPAIEANNERINGLRNLREYLHWEGRELEVGEITVEDDPMLLFMKTEGNERAFDALEGMVTDPDRPEDVLKVNADELGLGGDDDYDELRYACASRPALALPQVEEEAVRPWDTSVLKAESEKLRRVKDRALTEGDELTDILEKLT